jgi:signal recognition particle receptor subunit beta
MSVPFLTKGFSGATELKIVIAGSKGVGKSTTMHTLTHAPQTLSAAAMIGRDIRAFRKEALNHHTATAAMEYGVTYINNHKVHLYALPEPKRFEFMANILCLGASGLIIEINNEASDPLQELNYYLTLYSDFLKNHPAIIAITHYDSMQIHNCLRNCKQQLDLPVFGMDARNYSDVEKVFTRLLSEINNHQYYSSLNRKKQFASIMI